MNRNGKPIIPGEVLISEDDVAPLPERRPIRVGDGLVGYSITVSSLAGLFILDRYTNDSSVESNIVASAVGAIVFGAAAMCALHSLHNRGIIELEQ